MKALKIHLKYKNKDESVHHLEIDEEEADENGVNPVETLSETFMQMDSVNFLDVHGRGVYINCQEVVEMTCSVETVIFD